MPTQEKKPKRGRGRPKGSKNKNHRDVTLNAEMTQVQTMLKRLIKLTETSITLVYFVYDGAFGNNAAAQITRQAGLHLISKLRNNSALFFEWEGEYIERGRKPIYGAKVDYSHLPKCHSCSVNDKKEIRPRIYQMPVRHKKFADPLNVVIICKENLKPKNKRELSSTVQI